MKMTDLVIGEFYVWDGKRVKLLATGAVLQHYQHRGVQIEVAGADNAYYLKTVPTRELTSTWEDYQQARARWDRTEQLKNKELQTMQSKMHEVQEAMEALGLYDSQHVTLNAYLGYTMLSFESVEQMEKLTHALRELYERRENDANAGLH